MAPRQHVLGERLYNSKLCSDQDQPLRILRRRNGHTAIDGLNTSRAIAQIDARLREFGWVDT
jgi:hypothetical protein